MLSLVGFTCWISSDKFWTQWRYLRGSWSPMPDLIAQRLFFPHTRIQIAHFWFARPSAEKHVGPICHVTWTSFALKSHCISLPRYPSKIAHSVLMLLRISRRYCMWGPITWCRGHLNSSNHLQTFPNPRDAVYVCRHIHPRLNQMIATSNQMIPMAWAPTVLSNV